MTVLAALWGEFLAVLAAVARMLPALAAYLALILATLLLWRLLRRPAAGLDGRKTVTFGDASAVRSSLAASIVSILVIFLAWGAFTGSRLLPGILHMPGAFTGDASFTYLAEAPDGARDEGTVFVRVHPAGATAEPLQVPAGAGAAADDALLVQAYRSEIIRPEENDALGEGARVTAVNGRPIAPGQAVDVGWGRVTMTARGSLSVAPDRGWQMEPIWLPPPEAVWQRLSDIARDGFRNASLGEHLGYCFSGVLTGVLFGALVGIPLGLAMGLSDWFRGWFDPIVEFMRPVPPLALIPLVIIWAGIGEVGKIVLLFLAALWIMAIAARAGVAGVRLVKVQAAYALGAGRAQVLRHVILPNALPEILTGLRVAMGVAWGTVVAAELVAADKGAGMMIMTASKFQNTDIVIMGIVLIGVIGFAIDLALRALERRLVPWKGRA